MCRMSIKEVEVKSLSSTLDIHSTLTVPLRRYAKYVSLKTCLFPPHFKCERYTCLGVTFIQKTVNNHPVLYKINATLV